MLWISARVEHTRYIARSLTLMSERITARLSFTMSEQLHPIYCGETASGGTEPSCNSPSKADVPDHPLLPCPTNHDNRPPRHASQPAQLPMSLDQQAASNAGKIQKYIEKRGGKLLKTPGGKFWVWFPSARVPLDLNPQNVPLASLLITAAGIGSLTATGKLTIQRLQVMALRTSESITLRTFSTVQGGRLYIPTRAGTLLQLEASGTSEVPNVNNTDRLWLEHPCDNPPCVSGLQTQGDKAIRQGLTVFEKLLLDPIPCMSAVKWLVAMNLGLMPYIRDTVIARAIMLLQGDSQSGKTTSVERFLLLHGLGNVKGDFSTAALGDQGDIGLMAVDNIEHVDHTRSLIRYLLFAATGAERGRSSPGGNVRVTATRPVVVVTTIEGVHQEELRRRCITVTYRRQPTALDREPIEREISEKRDTILCSLFHVLRRYLEISATPATQLNLPGFGAHAQALVNLLRAYADVSGRPWQWAEEMMDLCQRELAEDAVNDGAEDMLEHQLHRAIARGRLDRPIAMEWGGEAGYLYVVQPSALLAALEASGATGHIPRTPAALTRRLSSATFKDIAILDEKNAPDVLELRRTSARRKVGLFVPTRALQGIQECSRALPPIPNVLIPLQPGPHMHLNADDRCYYIWDYAAAGTANEAPLLRATQQLVWDLKLCPSVNERLPGRPKDRALQHVSRALSALLPEEFRHATFVPMPPSETSEDRDDRLIRILAHVAKDVRIALECRHSTQPLQKDLSVSERIENLIVNTERLAPPPQMIVIVDDVISSGSHFRAAAQRLRDICPGVPIVGLFFARTIQARRLHASAGM